MKRPRRNFLRGSAGAASLLVMPRIAWAQAYPARPVRIVVGYPSGSSSDIVARLIGQWLSERLGQPFIVDNRAGAATNLATEAVVRAGADGYTLLLVTTPNAINATSFDKLNFNFLRDIAPVASIARVPLVMLVNALTPAKTVSQFIAYAKANPGKINLGTGGPGSLPHVSGELFKSMAGVDLTPVHYRSISLAATDLFAGRIHIIFDTLPSSLGHIGSGKAWPVAVTTAARLEVLPAVPAVAETLSGYDLSGWQGIGAPANTPMAILQKLNGEISAALVDPKFRAGLMKLGGSAFALSAVEFRNYLVAETEKWGRVIRAVNIKAE